MTTATARRKGERPRRARVLAARLVQAWGVCTVLVSAGAAVLIAVAAVHETWLEVTHPPEAATDWVQVTFYALVFIGMAGWLPAVWWVAFRGLRQVVDRVAGRDPARRVRTRLVPRGGVSAGGGGFFGGGGGDSGGFFGGGDGGGGGGGDGGGGG